MKPLAPVFDNIQFAVNRFLLRTLNHRTRISANYLIKKLLIAAADPAMSKKPVPITVEGPHPARRASPSWVLIVAAALAGFFLGLAARGV